MNIGYDLRPAQGPSAGRGIGRYTLSLLRALASEAGARVNWTLITFAGRPLPNAPLPPGAQIITLPDSYARPLARALGRFGKDGPRLLAARAADRADLRRLGARLDVLLFPACFEMEGFTALAAPCPIVKVCYDFGPFVTGAACAQGRVYGMLYRQEMAALARAQAVVAISDFTRADLLRLTPMPPERAHRIYPGLEPEFRPVPFQEVERARARLGLPNAPCFLASGGLDPHKNLECAIDALALLRARGEGDAARAVLLVLGAPPEMFHPRRAEVREHARARGLPESALLFLPRVADNELAALYVGAIALVFPSRFEGFGLPPLEAMACGTPVLVSNMSALPEAVGDASQCFDPDDAPGMANAMERLLTNPVERAAWSQRGQARAASFTWQRAARETLRLLEQVTKPQ